MNECICNNCRNLKGIMDETGAIDQYECEFGFPSEACTDCDGESSCDIKCSYFVSDEQEIITKVKCTKCGKELEQSCDNSDEGETYCISCYLKGL